MQRYLEGNEQEGGKQLWVDSFTQQHFDLRTQKQDKERSADTKKQSFPDENEASEDEVVSPSKLPQIRLHPCVKAPPSHLPGGQRKNQFRHFRALDGQLSTITSLKSCNMHKFSQT